MSLISEEDREYLKEEFSNNLKRKVTLLYFKKEKDESEYSKQTMELLEELASLNENLSLVTENCGNADRMKEEELTLCPSIKIKSGRTGFINFYGVPAGHEFISLVEAIKDMGSENLSLPEDVLNGLKEIEKPADIKVFITHGCPYCPGAVRTAHQFSLANKNIKASLCGERSPQVIFRQSKGSLRINGFFY
ncbi:MAG: glutaredoxin [candidate division WOR-3 bacterium]